MRPGPIVLIGAGIWVLFQVLGGDALGRLGIAGPTTAPGQHGLTGG